MRLALALEKVDHGCVGDQAYLFCEDWPGLETLDGRSRLRDVFHQDDGAEQMKQLLRMFDSEQIKKRIMKAERVDGKITAAGCTYIEVSISKLSSRRKGVSTGRFAPTDAC